MSIYRVRTRLEAKKQDGSTEETAQALWLERLRRNAGVGAGAGRDPVYALSESFAQTFDLVGRQNVQQTQEGREAAFRGTSMLPWIADDQGRFLRRFSEYAFQNGRLASAILQGQGNLALQACLRRAHGWALRSGAEQDRRIDKTAERNRVPFTDAWVHSGGGEHAAVALVTKAASTASQVLMLVRRAAARLDGLDNRTLRELFPFLFEEEDLALIHDLQAKRRQLQRGGASAGAESRAVNAALDKAQAVLAKKRQARRQFLTKLDTMLANARAAERLFAEQWPQASQALETDVTQTPQTPEDAQENQENVGQRAGNAARDQE